MVPPAPSAYVVYNPRTTCTVNKIIAPSGRLKKKQGYRKLQARTVAQSRRLVYFVIPVRSAGQAPPMQMVPEVPHLNWLIFNNITSREAQGEEVPLLPQASRCALVLGISMTSRILHSDVSDATCGG